MSENFQIHSDISLLPATGHETYQNDGFGGVCTGGTAIIKLFSVSRKISKNDLVTVLPQQLVCMSQVSDDFSMTFFRIGKPLFLDVMSGMGKLTPEFFFYMRRNFCSRLSAGDTQRFLGFCRVLDFRGSNDDPFFRRETILHLLRIYYWDHYVAFQKNTRNSKTPILNSRKEKIAFQFAQLVCEHCTSHREVVSMPPNCA